MQLRFLIILTLILLAEYYSFVVVRSSLRNVSPTLRIGFTTLYIVLTAIAWGGALCGMLKVIDFSKLPHLVRNLYIAFTLGFTIGKILILAVMLMDDLRRLVLWVIQSWFTASTKTVPIDAPAVSGGISRSMFLKRTALVLGGTALFGFMYGITNRYNYHIRRIALKFPKLPASFRGLKIVQISDIHSGSFDNEAAVARGVQKILDEKPDLILFTGDLVNNKAEEILPYMDIFSRLKAPLGVYSTLGNHDYADYVQEWHGRPDVKRANLERLKGHHAAMGWRLLMNEHVLLNRSGEDAIALIGIENWSAKPQFPKYGKMAEAYAGLPEKGAPVKILMSHDPSHWDAEVLTQYPDIDLTLSGHTHGMQFGIEIPGFKWSPVKWLYKNWAGLYQQGAQYLYVNRGYGFLGYPGRLGILPEITVIELT